MLYRLFLGLHWIFFIAFVASWGLLIGVELKDDSFSFERELIEIVESVHPIDTIMGAVMFYIPPVFLFIDWVVNGKWTWFPWKRNK